MDDFYRVPLSTAEAIATAATLRLVGDLLQRDGVVSEVPPEIWESAASRIEAEMPEFFQGRVQQLRENLETMLSTSNFSPQNSDNVTNAGYPPFPIKPSRRLLETIKRVSRIAEIEYYVASRNEWTVRRVEIEDVYEDDRGTYLAGRCSLRNDYRQFRLDHIRSVRPVPRGGGENVNDEDDLPDPFDDEGNA